MTIDNSIADAQRCTGTETNKWGDKYRCPRVATTTVDGKRLCLTCARKWTEAKGGKK